MKRFLVLMVAVLVAALAVAPAAWAGDVQGKIKSVDQTGRMLTLEVTLEDGTQLVIPATVQVNRKDLMPGADVKAAFEEKGSQKAVTSIEVKLPAK